MKRVLITGAAGFLGSHLCDRFINDGLTKEQAWYVVDILDCCGGYCEDHADEYSELCDIMYQNQKAADAIVEEKHERRWGWLRELFKAFW